MENKNEKNENETRQDGILLINERENVKVSI